ncbi:hypothetical protein GWK36_11335 [Caldichromatium japonicum]|uniref:Uncharacterized protein n=1 Tax=Caldichromatium japonicum TaxID=2699430 RepID=A0A6G7VF21_9GAMM|nr:hypothetical protein [Caldichromatium japonicum]QIK38475.1 hypothetical protein GWK36_11335 [Caldichromatium japonicum]
MNRPLTLSLACCLALGCPALEVAAQTTTKPYAYTMKITPSRPKGSLAETMSKDKTKPSTIVYTPCTDESELKQDVVAFKLDYDAGKATTNKDKTQDRSAIRDVYLFFYNPNALGALADDPNWADNPFNPPCRQDPNDPNSAVVPCDPKVWAVVRSTPASMMSGGIALVPFAEISDIDPATHLYLSANENVGSGKISEQLLRSYIRFDDALKGVWSLTGIIASSPTTAAGTSTTPVNFTDPSTWAAWDTATFMVGTPWIAFGQPEGTKTCK